MMQAVSAHSRPHDEAADQAGLQKVDLMGLDLWRCTRSELLDHLFERLDAGEGGWIVTANLDFLRRFVHEPEARDLYASADVCVADGMPLIWACALQGRPLPERIAGSSLVWDLAERAAGEGRSIYLLGGSEGTADAAAAVLQRRWPSLEIAGTASPKVDAIPSQAQIDELASQLESRRPGLVLVALGSPKQERLIRALRPHVPDAWMIGVGVSFSFVAGTIRRAPPWMQRAGLEWVHRLAQEPRRLARRYLIEDVPFGLRMLGHAWAKRRRPGDRSGRAAPRS